MEELKHVHGSSNIVSVGIIECIQKDEVEHK